jgi:hypothetical protein
MAITHLQRAVGGDPAHTNDLGATVSANNSTQRSNAKYISGKARSDEIEELVDVRCATVHHRHLLDCTCTNHAFVEQLHRLFAGASLAGFFDNTAADVDQRLD